MSFRFEFADKGEISALLPILFDILYDNMNEIAPTGNSYDEDKQSFLDCVAPAMAHPARQIVLMYDDEKLVGYFQYYVNAGMFMMEEIQLIREYHGSGLFGAFYRWLIPQLPDGIERVEAYADKRNIKSQSVLAHLGLEQIGENKNGNSYHYRGDYTILHDRYGEKG